LNPVVLDRHVAVKDVHVRVAAKSGYEGQWIGRVMAAEPIAIVEPVIARGDFSKGNCDLMAQLLVQLT
jgi:hypothetical protein